MRTSPKSVVCAAVLLTLGTTLTGCGGDDTKKPVASASASPTGEQLLPSGGPSTSSASPAQGPTLDGTGYTLNLPKDWTDITAAVKASEPRIDKAGRFDARGKDFTANLNVLTTKSTVTGTPSRAQLNTLAIQTRSEVVAIAPKLRTLELASLDGADAVHQEGDATYGKVPLYLVQFCAIRDGVNYVLTFTFPTGVDQAARDKVVDPVLASFTFQ